MLIEKFLGLSRLHKQFIALFLDVIMLPLTFCFAIWLRYDGLNKPLLEQYILLVIAVPLISIPIFIRIGLYRAVIRYIDQRIIYVVLGGLTLSVVMLTALAAIATHMHGISRGVFGIYWVSAIFYVLGSRFIVRGYLSRTKTKESSVRIAIYGAGKAGMQLVSALRFINQYKLVAFIDDKKELRGATNSGIKVYSPDDLNWLIESKGVQEIFLAMPSLKRGRQKRILEKLESYKIKIKVTPPIESLVNGKLRVQDIREIEVEDLLGRDPVSPDAHLISSCITAKSVLVTGAGGSIGSELCRQIIVLRPSSLFLLEISEYALYLIEQELQSIKSANKLEVELVPFLGSVLDQKKCEKILGTFSIDTVYHAAAYKHVPLVEHNPIEGLKNNSFGTLRMAQAAIKAKVSTFVLISTDKAVRPTNVMGSTKRLAELILQALAKQSATTKFTMVRFGNVLGSSGSVVPLFRKQIMEGGPITLTHPEITRYFMTIPEAAQLVLQAGAMGTGGDVFVLDMGEPVKIIDLATRMVHLSGLEIRSEETPDGNIEIEYIGLRPGEKLYEELLVDKNVEGTTHPLIMRALETELPWNKLKDVLDALEQACIEFDYQKVRSLLLMVITEYIPQCDIQDFIWNHENKLLNDADNVYRVRH